MVMEVHLNFSSPPTIATHPPLPATKMLLEHQLAFSSQPTRDFPLPNEIAHLLVAEHLHTPGGAVDNALFDAVSRTSPLLRDICHSIRFKSLTINVRSKDVQDSLRQFAALLRRNPRLASFVRTFTIADNTMPRVYTNEAMLPIREPPGTKWLAHVEMEGDGAYVMFFEGGVGAEFATMASVLLSNLQNVNISFVYRSVQWGRLSTPFKRLLENVISRQRHLTTLIIQGVDGVPQRLLRRFSSLCALGLVDISVDTRTKVILDQQQDAFSSPYKLVYKQNLQKLTLRNVPSQDALSLLQFWKDDAPFTPQRGCVDMSCPHKIEVYFGASEEHDFPRHAIRFASKSLKQLVLSAYAVGMDNSVLLDDIRMGGPLLTHPSDPYYESLSSWFASVSDLLVQPEDIVYLTSLEYLEIHVSLWVGERNKELEWALELLKHIPTQNLETVIIRVKMGGYWDENIGFERGWFLDAVYFSLMDAFLPWAEELRKEKWRDLESFIIELDPLPDDSMDAKIFVENIELLAKGTAGQFPKGLFDRRRTRFAIRHLSRTDEGFKYGPTFKYT